MKKGPLFSRMVFRFFIVLLAGAGLLNSSAEAATTLFSTGWENGQTEGLVNRAEYSREVAGYFNSSNPPPECGRRYRETLKNGDYSLMIAGYSKASYAYCYYRVFDQNIPVTQGTKLSYWIYHAAGSPKVSVDGHFTDGKTLRDFQNNGYLTDQFGVRIHPGLRKDPMKQWTYVEVDLSKAAGKTIDFILFAFDNGGDGFKGQYRAYVDDFKVSVEDPGFPGSITKGFPKGAFGSGGQTDEVTAPETWRWSEWFYGHQGIDMIAWVTVCGEQHNYVMGWHQNDLVEYLMKFGGDYSRLVLRGLADQPGPVEFEITVDGQYKARSAWDNNNGCNEETAVDIPNVPYGTHAMAFRFVNDGTDRDFLLDGLLVQRSSTPAPAGSNDLFGLCINANYSEQNPPDSELSDLGVKWIRSIRYQNGFPPNHGNAKWLVIFNQETIPKGSNETWSAYVDRFATTVKQIVQDSPWMAAIEVWNEQDLPDGDHAPGDGRYLTPQNYAPLLKATYQKVKQLSNPPIVVVGGFGSGGPNAASYMNQVRQANGGIYYDAVGFHPYLATCGGIGWPSNGTMEGSINTLYAASGGKPIWLTEFGAGYQHLDNDKNKQAQYLTNCYEIFPDLKDGSKQKVGVAFWFAWDDRTHYNPSGESFGLVEQNRSGSSSTWRRPAWYAYADLTGDDPEPPTPPSGRTSKIHGTVLECSSETRFANMYVSIWRHDNQQFLTTTTNGSGIYEFTGLDPNQKYNLAVNAVYDPNNCDCCPFRRVDANRKSAIRNDVELVDGGDGWHGENFRLCSGCP